MSPDIVGAADPLITTAIGTILGLGGAVGAAAILVPQVSKRILPKPIETRLADYLPFERLLPDGRTVVCRDGTVCQFVAVTGIDQTFIKEGEAVAFYEARKKMFDDLAEVGVTLRIFTIRDPFKVETSLDYKNERAHEIARRWNANFEVAFRTHTVMCVSMRGKGAGSEGKLDEAITIIETALMMYKPVVLTQNPDQSPDKDMTVGSFLGRIVAPINRPAPKAFGGGLSDALAGDEVEFLKNGRVSFRDGPEHRLCSVIGLRRLGDDTTAMLASELNSIAAESIVLQIVEPQAKGRTMLILKQQERMMASTSFSADVGEQYEAAIEAVGGLADNSGALCHFSEAIFLFAKTEEELARIEKTCRQILINHGITGVREKGAAQASWFNQFPSMDVKPRVYRLLSHNVALLSTFERPPAGLPRSDWGPGPIATMYTGSNTVYQHQFHVSMEPAAVGHGVCIAPTGGGKTTLMAFLSCMASRHQNLRHFFFDRYQGTYIYTTAMDGQYLSFNAEKLEKSVAGGMNPLACDPTDENREFLKQWLQAITGCSKYEDMEQIGAALEIAFEHFTKEERSLRAIYDAGFTPGSDIHKELFKWVDPLTYGTMFNAPRDCIDLDDNWLTTFDMTKLLDDEVLAGASVGYILHRIRQTLRRTRSNGFCFIDETEPLLRNAHFRNIYLVMLQEFRKLGGVIVSVFQRPEALSANKISELVRQQCGTYYLFPNSGANAKDYADFELTDREMGFILGQTQPARRIKRGLLIKKPTIKESVIVDVDLSSLGPYLKIFSSTSRHVQLASDLQRQFGSAWVEHILDSEAP